jgi:Uma2 family endonuclease
MPITEELLVQVVLADPEGQWELHRGRLREKPDMSVEHNYVLRALARLLTLQIDPAQFVVSPNTGRLARHDESNYIPDLFVLPAERERAARRRQDPLEVYRDPIPLVIEIWSPSTGRYDIDDKLPEYQKRGDQEIWRFHPFERTLKGWRRQSDGSFAEFLLAHGIVEPIALPGVRIDLDALFAPPD